MTSGNISDEPIAYRDDEARERLTEIADLFLVHDREIHTRADDSVIRVFRGNPLFLRRSRGYVPRSVKLPATQRSVLAVGGELKAVVCLTREDRGFMSQHIGDLKNAATLRLPGGNSGAPGADTGDHAGSGGARPPSRLSLLRLCRRPERGPAGAGAAPSRPHGLLHGGKRPGGGDHRRDLRRHRLRPRRHHLGRGIPCRRLPGFSPLRPFPHRADAGRGRGGKRAVPHGNLIPP